MDAHDHDEDDRDDRMPLEQIGTGHGPRDRAEAAARRHRSESETPAGLMDQAVRLQRELLDDARTEARQLRTWARADAAAIIAKAQEQADKILEQAAAAAEHQRSEQRAIAHTTAELVQTQLQTQKDLNSVYEKLRAPAERAPTGAEATTDFLKHTVTEVTKLLGKDRRLLAGLATRLGAPSEAQGTGEGAEGEPLPTESVDRADTEQAEFDALRFEDLAGLVDRLGAGYVYPWLKERGVTGIEDVTFGHARQLFHELKRRERGGKASSSAGAP
jgi:F0F1-type ATP synthase membrane subunit b/b'